MSSERAAKRQKKAATSSSNDVEPAIPLAKTLASSDKRERDRAIKALAGFLIRSGQNVIPPKEMAKLWRGIFQCFYHSDKPLVQQALADELSNLMLLIPQSASDASNANNDKGKGKATEMSDRARAALAFLEGFWDSMVREWALLDKHRVPKFYLLMRRFVNASLRLLSSEDWNAAAVDRFTQIWTKEGGALCSTDPKVPTSIKNHICDVFVDELDKILLGLRKDSLARLAGSKNESKEEEQLLPLLDLLSPFIAAAARTPAQALYKRVMEEVLGPILNDAIVLSTPVPRDAASDADDIAVVEKAETRCRRIILASTNADYLAGRQNVTADLADTDAEGEEANDTLAQGEIEQLLKPNRAGKLRQRLVNALFVQASQPTAVDSSRFKIYKLQMEERNRREEMEEESGTMSEDEDPTWN